MVKYLLLLFLCLPGLLHAQSQSPIRNDGAATTVQSTNLGNSRISTTSKGEVFGVVLTPVPITASTAIPVAVVSPLPAGSNTIGNIGSITTSVVPGTAASNLGKAEDAPSAGGDTGVAAYSVRSDTLSTTTSLSGDYQPLKSDAVGSLYVVPGTQEADSESGTLEFDELPGTLITNAGTNVYRLCVFSNLTDQPITLLHDSGGVVLLNGIPSGETITLELASAGRDVRTTITANYTTLFPDGSTGFLLGTCIF